MFCFIDSAFPGWCTVKKVINLWIFFASIFIPQVALKTLIVIHRALREVDPTFREELINYGRSRSHMLNLAYFKDDSSAGGTNWHFITSVVTFIAVLDILTLNYNDYLLLSCSAWDFSAWIRTYALYLEERLECFRVLKYDVETDPPVCNPITTLAYARFYQIFISLKLKCNFAGRKLCLNFITTL